jgi:hypothetical protein
MAGRTAIRAEAERPGLDRDPDYGAVGRTVVGAAETDRRRRLPRMRVIEAGWNRCLTAIVVSGDLPGGPATTRYRLRVRAERHSGQLGKLALGQRRLDGADVLMTLFAGDLEREQRRTAGDGIGDGGSQRGVNFDSRPQFWLIVNEGSRSPKRCPIGVLVRRRWCTCRSHSASARRPGPPLNSRSRF